ncbi:MAG: lipopolysaccharide kinase InaA family protein, partial [Planctomycetota bacterium]|nr:lipopolysaccharide kinase InaA family protein [Planctomycetota bacterium]
MASTDPSTPPPTAPWRQLPGRHVELHPELGEAHKVWRASRLARRLGDRRRATAELRTLDALFRAGLPVPEPRGLEREPGGGWRLRMALVPGARTAEEALLAALGDNPHGTTGELGALLARLGRLLARLHAAGLDQADLHAGNALVDESGGLWAIDFQAAELRQPLRAGVLERDLVVLCAAWRERLGLRARQRLLVAWLQALPAGLRAGLAPGLAARIELAAVRRRRAQVTGYERRDSRWFRVSGTCRPAEGARGEAPEPARGARVEQLVLRTLPSSGDRELLAALDAGALPEGWELRRGDEALAAWG